MFGGAHGCQILYSQEYKEQRSSESQKNDGGKSPVMPHTQQMTSTLPSEFILFMSERHSSKDVCSGLVHMTTEYVNNPASGHIGYHLTQSPPALDQIYSIHHIPSLALPMADYPRSFVRVLTVDNHLLYKRFVNISQAFYAVNPSGQQIAVYSIIGRTEVFKGIRLKRNVGFTIVTQENPDTNTIVPAPPFTPSYRKNKQLSGTSTFLAKQAMELAIMKKETCPITMDDFSTSNTAVMPCGHLFSAIAIAESFKKCPNQCPICRTGGLATFV